MHLGGFDELVVRVICGYTDCGRAEITDTECVFGLFVVVGAEGAGTTVNWMNLQRNLYKGTTLLIGYNAILIEGAQKFGAGFACIDGGHFHIAVEIGE